MKRHLLRARDRRPGGVLPSALAGFVAGLVIGFVVAIAATPSVAAEPAGSADPPAPGVEVDAETGGPAEPTSTIEFLRHAAEALIWSDEIIRHDWRLQRRPGSDACRILDARDTVVRTGTRRECVDAFAALERSGQAAPVRGRTVIVLHGLGEGRRSMRPLVDFLRHTIDATVLSFGYASAGAGLEEHGRSLAAVVASLPAEAPVSFVGHSLGNLVVRRWMGLAAAADLARVDRVVMLGPPNQGSELARRVARIDLLASLSHGAARELVLDWQRVAPQLAIPSCPFGIVAGGKGDDHGYSSVLSGDDDAVVRVDETRLDGADDFLLLPVHHAAMMQHPAVQRATASFLETGRFAAAAAE